MDERSKWLNHGLWSSTDNDRYCRQVFAEAFCEAESLELHQRFMWVFEKLHLVGLLQRLDSSTMAAGVEGRVPFVDHELVELVVSMPLKYKLRWRSPGHMVMASLLNSDQISETYDVTKYILRSAYRGILPDAVIERRKVGFPVPLQRMMSGGFIERARQVLLDPSIAGGQLFDGAAVEELLTRRDVFENHRTALKVWMLLNLAIWHNEVWG
jgi:asparagine synthase (glutamine-hydrolysing)